MNRSLKRIGVWTRCLALAAASLHSHAQVSATDRIVDLTSREVSAYLDHISDVTCTEQVSQVKLDPNGKVLASAETTYSYLVLLQANQEDFLLSESRLPQPPEHRPQKNISLLLTNGFSMLFLIFHPYYAQSYHFEQSGQQVLDG